MPIPNKSPDRRTILERQAEDWLRDLLDQVRRSVLPGTLRTGATFADAAAEWLRYIEHDRGRKPSTLQGYSSALSAHLLPAFGSMPVEDMTTGVDRALAGWVRWVGLDRNKLLIQLHGILKRARKVYRLPGNAAAEVEKFPQRRSGDIEVFSPEEVWALVRAAACEQDAAVFLTAAALGIGRYGERRASRRLLFREPLVGEG